MRKFLFLILICVAFVGKSALRTWISTGSTTFSVAANWSGGVAPTSADNVVFSSSSSVNCNITANIVVSNFSINAGYVGTISGGSSNITIRNGFYQSSGTFNSTTAYLRIGTTAGGILSYTGGTFNHAGGNVLINTVDAAASSISGNVTFNNLTINSSNNIGNEETIIFGNQTTGGLILTGQSQASYQGTINITNSLSIQGFDPSTTFSANTGVFNFNGASGSIVGNGSSGINVLPNITINTTGAMSMSGVISLIGTWKNTNIGSLNSGTSSVDFYGVNGSIVSGTTAATRAYFHNLNTDPSGGPLNVSGTSQICLTRNLTDNGGFTANNSLLIANGSAAQSFSSSIGTLTINALMNSGANTLSFGSPAILLDSLKITAGTVNGANLTLQSTSSLKARIAEITGGSLTGNITVQTFAPGGTTDWSVLGVSGVNSQAFSNWYGQIPMCIETSSTGVTSAGGNYFESCQGWDETTNLYDTSIVLATPLTPGKGYWVYLGTGLGSTSDMVWSVNGTPVTGNVNIGLTAASSGYNLISNPYASPISWNKLRNGNASVDDAIYIYNADLGTTTSYVSGVSSNPAPAGANDVIAMGQGFYVHATGNTNLTAMESNKVSSNTGNNPLLRTAAANTPSNVLYLRLDSPNDYDQTAIRFSPATSYSFDTEFDAYKMFTSPGYIGYPGTWSARTSISTRLGNVDYSINSIPVMPNDAVIPVLAKALYSGQHTITPVNIAGLPPDVCVILKDKLTNTSHDLRSGAYVCNISDTTTVPRFELTVCSNAAIVNIKQNVNSNNAMFITPDKIGATVNLNFAVPTDATISVTNILGQKVLPDLKVKAVSESYQLDLSNNNNQLLFVTVTTNDQKITKKIVR